MSVPVINLVMGLDRDFTLRGPGVATLDWNEFDDIRFICPGLSISLLQSTGGVAAMEVIDDGANLLLHFLVAHTASKQWGRYDYAVHGKVDDKWTDIPGHRGVLDLAPAMT